MSPSNERTATLSGVEAKVERAESHLAEIADWCVELRREAAPRLTYEIDPEAGDHVTRIFDLPELGPTFATRVGDVVHNLRSALDHLAWQLVIASGNTPDHRTQFPILSKRAQPLPDLSGGATEAIRSVLEELQPYQRTRASLHQLELLRVLSNIDKHRTLVTSIVSLRHAGWTGDGVVEFREDGWNSGPYRDGDEVCRFGVLDPEAATAFRPLLTFQVRLNEPDLLGIARAQDVPRVLSVLLDYIRFAIVKFEVFFE